MDIKKWCSYSSMSEAFMHSLPFQQLSLQEKCVHYWPAEGSVSFGEYVLELKRDTLCETFSIRDMLLSYASVS